MMSGTFLVLYEAGCLRDNEDCGLFRSDGGMYLPSDTLGCCTSAMLSGSIVGVVTGAIG